MFVVTSPKPLTPPFSPKGLTAGLVFLHMVLQWSRVALTQPVDVQDGHQVVQLIVGGEGHGLPHRALRQLSITQQAEHPVTAYTADIRINHFSFYTLRTKHANRSLIHAPASFRGSSRFVTSSDSSPVR